jgi:hypothetical protein
LIISISAQFEETVLELFVTRKPLSSVSAGSARYNDFTVRASLKYQEPRRLAFIIVSKGTSDVTIVVQIISIAINNEK